GNELGVAVADQQPEPLGVLAEVHHKGLRWNNLVCFGRVVSGGVEGVVPLAVEVVSGQNPLGFQGFDLAVGDLDSGPVGGGVEFGVDGESRSGGGRGDRLHDDFVTGQRPSSPVHRDVGEQPVLDFVPFAGAWRQVAHGDRQAGGAGQGGQLDLPQPGAVAVGAPTVGADQQPG